MVIIAALIIGLSLLAQEIIQISYMEMRLEQLEDSLDYARIGKKLSEINEKLKD